MRVLVCGGRYFGREFPSTPVDVQLSERKRIAREQNLLRATLTTLYVDGRLTEIMHGGARGADEAAGAWAARNMIKCTVYRPDWKARGKVAGPERNQRMIDEGKPELVIAFRGGKGTADMVRRARAAGIEVMEVE